MSGNDEKNTNQVAAINLIKQRNSAFAAVLKKAEIAAGGAAPAANPGGEKVVSVETRKRPSEIQIEESEVKRPKLDANETFIMRLPASAQSGLCHQRAKETLDQQRKLSDTKAKQRFKWVHNPHCAKSHILSINSLEFDIWNNVTFVKNEILKMWFC